MKEAIKILKYHQRWRQGADIDMLYTPRQITNALDTLLDGIEELESMIEECINMPKGIEPHSVSNYKSKK